MSDELKESWVELGLAMAAEIPALRVKLQGLRWGGGNGEVVLGVVVAIASVLGHNEFVQPTPSEEASKGAVEKLLSECRIRERLRKLDPGPLASTTDKVVRPQLDGGAQDTSTAATSVTVAMDRTATGRLDSNGRLRAGASPSVRLEVLKVAAASGTHAAEAIGPRTAPDALGGTAGTDASEELVEVVDQCGSPQDLCDAEGAYYTMKELGLRVACARQPRVNEDCGGGPAEADYGAARSSPGACRCVPRDLDDCRCGQHYLDDGENGDGQDDDEESGLACSLLAAGAPEATILALCRWKGPQSLRIYARRNKHDIAAWVDTAEAQVLDSVQAPNLPGLAGGAPAATAAAVWPAAAAAVPGALPGGTYALLAALEGAAEEGPTAAALRALVDSVPEIDGDAWMHGVGVEADRHDLPGAEDHEGHSDDDAGSDGDGGGEAFGDLLLS